MARQLVLLEADADWRLDDATKDAGRRGVAAARAALADAVRRSATARTAA